MLLESQISLSKTIYLSIDTASIPRRSGMGNIMFPGSTLYTERILPHQLQVITT